MANVIFRFENGDPVMVSTMVGENLLETARKSNVVIDAPCSGNGSCGKCRVKLLSSLSKPPNLSCISSITFRLKRRCLSLSSVIGKRPSLIALIKQ